MLATKEQLKSTAVFDDHNCESSVIKMSSKKRLALHNARKARKKQNKIKKIYTPRGYDSEEEYMMEFEEERNSSNPPAWHKHFESEELLSRYEPNRELGII